MADAATLRAQSRQLLPLLGVFALAYWIFFQGVGGGFYFDDRSNLALLSQVRSFDTAMQFVLSGTAGPTGRPLSLASFALQADAWPDRPEAFIHANILIHLLNGVLVAWFVRLLAARANMARPTVIVVLATAFWLLHPIQVSSVLFVVQRMTLLSASFTLLGLVFYLLGRRPQPDRGPSWFWIILAFGMTLPATLCKENGILLPGMLLLVEFMVFSPSTVSTSASARSRLLLAWAGGILLAGLVFLGWQWTSFNEIVTAKGYSLARHGATEARALMEYLGQILVPRSTELGPFHDDFPISAAWHDPPSLASIAGLLIIAGMAWWGRKRFPLVSLGFFLFLWGHALESSIIPVEPYFEHRNYLPALGVALSLACLTQAGKDYRRLVTVGAAGMILVNAFAAFQYASIWGQRDWSPQFWHAQRPESARALLNLATHLAEQRQWNMVYRLVDKGRRRDPANMSLVLTAFYLNCMTGSGRPESGYLGELLQAAHAGPFSIQSLKPLNHAVDLVTNNRCPNLASGDILAMLDALERNPHYRVHADTRSDLLILRAKVEFQRGHIAQAAALLRDAIGQTYRIDMALLAARMYAQAGKQQEAEQLMRQAREKLPGNVWIRAAWSREIASTQAVIDKSRRGSSHAIH